MTTLSPEEREIRRQQQLARRTRPENCLCSKPGVKFVGDGWACQSCLDRDKYRLGKELEREIRMSRQVPEAEVVEDDDEGGNFGIGASWSHYERILARIQAEPQQELCLI